MFGCATEDPYIAIVHRGFHRTSSTPKSRVNAKMDELSDLTR
jgi:hypothetical protein